jgi:hypothetical protein
MIVTFPIKCSFNTKFIPTATRPLEHNARARIVLVGDAFSFILSNNYMSRYGDMLSCSEDTEWSPIHWPHLNLRTSLYFPRLI